MFRCAPLATLSLLLLGVACTPAPSPPAEAPEPPPAEEKAKVDGQGAAAAGEALLHDTKPALTATGGLPVVQADADGLNRGDMASEVEGEIVYGGEGSLTLSSFVGASPTEAKAGAIVAFGASWCGFCKASIPTLMRLQAENPTLQIVYVGTDTDNKGWEKEIAFFEREKVNFPLVRTENPLQTMRSYFGTKRNIPRFYLVDHKGEIRVKDQGFSEKKMGQLLPKQVRWLLAQAAPKPDLQQAAEPDADAGDDAL